MELRQVLTEIFQTCDGAGTSLYFIKYHECLSRPDCRSADHTSQFIKDPVNLQIMVKDRREGIIFFKVEVSKILKFREAEFLESISLAALPDTGNEQRFSVAACFPFLQAYAAPFLIALCKAKALAEPTSVLRFGSAR